MSASVSVMPSHMSHFERSHDFFSSPPDPSNADYQDLASLQLKSYEMPYPRSRGWSPNSSASSPSTGHSASFGRSSTAPSRSPPTRQLTPIRHHRPSVSRVHGGGRSEALLAYATQHDSHGTEPQSLASSQSAFPPSAYMMAPASSSYAGQASLYPSAGVPQHPHSGQYMMGPPAYSVEPGSSPYFSLGRSSSFEPSPSIQPSDAIFSTQLGSNPPSQNWPSSTSPPSLPSMPLPPSTTYSSSTLSSLDNPDGIRVLTSRPKPQCFQHGCNGRQFSTFSNLLRHQREKSGSASKHVCPYCGTEFTRTTARKGHVEGGKCKAREGDGMGKEIRGPRND